MNAPFHVKTYYGLALDPIHIGTGGYRLGRVDNTITREPGTNMPKIPGSSIAGVARAYTAMAAQSGANESKIVEKENGILRLNRSEYKKMKYQRPVYKRLEDESDIIVPDASQNPQSVLDEKGLPVYYSCAGKGANDGDGHCGMPDCEVCVPYGFSRRSGSSFQGLAQFCDARILFFPVHSMVGPVWVTSPSVIQEFHNVIKDQEPAFATSVQLPEDGSIQTDVVKAGKPLNLGWLLLNNVSPNTKPVSNGLSKLAGQITDRVVIVLDKLFSRIVNDNLEVRTSVAIDPATGAAEDGALFTYEAIPRATVLWFDVIYNRPEYYRIGGSEPIALEKPDNYLNPLKPGDIDDNDQMGFIAFNVERGLRYFPALGIGGMNTRGMGRLDVLNVGG